MIRWWTARRVVGATLLLLLVVVALGAVTRIASHDAVREPELRALAAAGHFTDADSAAATLTSVAERVIEQQRSCLAARRPRQGRCDALGVVAAWAQVSAIDIIGCPLPDVAATRVALLRLIDALAGSAEGGPIPRVPVTPRCG